MNDENLKMSMKIEIQFNPRLDMEKSECVEFFVERWTDTRTERQRQRANGVQLSQRERGSRREKGIESVDLA